MAQGAASTQHIEIALGKAFAGPFIDRIERIHQAIAEGIGVNVKGRVDEMGDIGPEVAVIVTKKDRRPQAFALGLQPDITETLGGQLAGATFVMDPAFKIEHRNLAHDRIQHVLDLTGQHHPAPPRIVFGLKQRPEGQHLSEYAGGFGQSQRGVGHQGSARPGKDLVDAVAELMGQGHHIAGAALIIEQQIGMHRGHRGMGESAGRLARTRRHINPGGVEKALSDRRQFG